MEIREYRKFNADGILSHYTQVGWTAYTNDMVSFKQVDKNSLLILAAYESNELIGIIRIISDGFAVILVQDILVYPQKQKRALIQRYSRRFLPIFKRQANPTDNR